MKSSTVIKAPFCLLSLFAISVLLIIGIVQTRSFVEIPEHKPTKETGLEQSKTTSLEPKNQRSLQSQASSQSVNQPTQNSQPVKRCNPEFSTCPVLPE
jgi:hypothetical protein